MSSRIRLFAALISIAVAAACILESARRDASPVEAVRVAEPF